MIEVKNLTKRFDGFTALNRPDDDRPDGLCLRFGRPQRRGQIDRYIRHITGVYRPDSGEVLVGGEPVFENPPVKARIACIPGRALSCHAGGNHPRASRPFIRGFYPRVQ